MCNVLKPLNSHPPADSSATRVEGMRFHHVGVAVKDLEDALKTHVDLFGCTQVSNPVPVPDENVRVCFVSSPPGVLIELIEGIGDESPVKHILDRTGAGTYHICYEVDELDAAIKILRKNKCLPFRRFELAEHGNFAFLLSPQRQLFELCEITGTRL
jgi:methylmalonyl-CoA/ethylmalonyl-CoA epimerase